MPQGTSSQNIGCTLLEMQILISQEMPNNKNFEAPKQAELNTYYSEFLNYFQSWDVALDLRSYGTWSMSIHIKKYQCDVLTLMLSFISSSRVIYLDSKISAAHKPWVLTK